MKQLKVLFDFDNLKEFSTRVSLEQIASYIANNKTIKSNKYNRITIKLYGGWFEEDRPSAVMQELKSQKSSHYFENDDTKTALHITFAQSLESRATNNIFHTFRLTPFTKQLKYFNNGGQHYCEIESAIKTINNRNCTNATCKTNPSTIKSYEQKIVDSMIVADLIYLADSTADDVCIVSSDDDMIPGILTATLKKKILHLWINTNPNQRYLSILRKISNYIGEELRSK